MEYSGIRSNNYSGIRTVAHFGSLTIWFVSVFSAVTNLLSIEMEMWRESIFGCVLPAIPLLLGNIIYSMYLWAKEILLSILEFIARLRSKNCYGSYIVSSV